MNDQEHFDCVIVGAGVAGLACAKVLHENKIDFTVLEKDSSPGGRIKTDFVDGFQLDHGFQVLQTGYSDISNYLDLDSLDLASFPAGVGVRYNGRFHIVADPRHHVQNLYSTVASSIGTFGDRIRLLKLALSVCRRPMEDIFDQPEEKTIDFLKLKGFSERFIQSFFTPFFAGACLDRSLAASSRVLKYIIRLFAMGDAALPAGGMVAIPQQLASVIPQKSVQYNTAVVELKNGRVSLADGRIIRTKMIVVATHQPDFCDLLQIKKPKTSVSEACLYFSSEWQPPFNNPFLLLNGENHGPINNIAFPSMVSPHYAPAGKTLIAIVVLDEALLNRDDLEDLVRIQCAEWFGAAVDGWEHIKTYRIYHALPDQSPPTENPYLMPEPVSEGIMACGEHKSLPGLQWALMSGAMAGKSVVKDLTAS